MKLSAANLKNLDYKQLGIDHGEKIVLGLFGLIVLGALAMTQWSSYEKTPADLENRVTQAQERLRTSTWPDEERQQFLAMPDLGQRVDDLLRHVAVDPYDYTTAKTWPLRPQREKIKEPEWLAAVEPMARVSIAPVVITVDKNAGQRRDANDGQLAEADQAQQPMNNPGLEAQFGPLGGAAGGNGPNIGGGPGANNAMAETQTVSNLTPQGYRCVSVVALVEYRKQLERLAKALNEQPGNVEPLLQYLDFELERQQAVAGNDPWSGPWKRVELDVARDVLFRAADYDDEVVDQEVTHPVFTMPLPERALGVWDPDTLVSHPRIKNFELTPEGREMQRKMNEYLVRKQQELEADRSQEIRPGGFAPDQANVRGLTRKVAASRDFTTYVDEMTSSMGGRNQAGLKDQIKNRITAQGQLLLFRYLDFDVEPGNAYRYRVRLVLANPNFNRPLDEVVAPFVVEEPLRYTPWSQETRPVVVPRDYDYFVEKIEAPRSRTAPLNASIEIFQRHPKYGTTINHKLKFEPGQMIGGSVDKTPVLIPPESFEDDAAEFHTNSLLVDLDFTPALSSKDHPELELSSTHRAPIAETALVTNEYGELVAVDRLSRQQAYQRQKQLLEWEQRPFQELREKPKQAEGGDLDALAREMGEENPKGRRARRDPNPTRRRGGDVP